MIEDVTVATAFAVIEQDCLATRRRPSKKSDARLDVALLIRSKNL